MGKDRDNRFIMGLLVGGAGASLVALLLAPKSGAAIRSDLMRGGEGWRSKAAAAAVEMRDRGATGLQEVRQHVEQTAGTLSHRGSSMVDNLRGRSAGEGVIAGASRPTAQISEPEESPETVGLLSQDSRAQGMAPPPGATVRLPLQLNAHPERIQQSGW